MGRRKSRKAPKPGGNREKLKLPTIFDCPFCNHEKTVDCKMRRDQHIGELLCSVCGTSYQVTINYLSEPVDVYSAWIDKCEEEKQKISSKIHTGDNDEDEDDYGDDYDDGEDEDDDN